MNCSKCKAPGMCICSEVEKPKLVQLHDGRPALNDIPGRLRLLADEIDRGEYDNAESVIVVMNAEQKNDWPRVWGYGNVDGEFNPIITLQLALSWWINKIVVRK